MIMYNDPITSHETMNPECPRTFLVNQTTRGLYIFYPTFYWGLYCRGVSITDNLCTKQENSSIFEPKIRDL